MVEDARRVLTGERGRTSGKTGLIITAGTREHGERHPKEEDLEERRSKK